MYFAISLLLLLPATQAKNHSVVVQCTPVDKFKGKLENILGHIAENVYPVFSVCTNSNITTFYNDAMTYYEEAVKDPLCQKYNFKRAKVNMFDMMHQQLVSIWDVANCQDCVDRQNETTEFLQLYTQLDTCINVTSSPCEPCAGNYSEVQARYELLAKGHRDSICFDIEDRMNQTRYHWSATYKCCKNKQHSTKAFAGFAAGLCSLPVIFYLAMYLVTRRKEARELLVNGPLLDESGNSSRTTAELGPEASGSGEVIGSGIDEPVGGGGGQSESDSDDEEVNFQPRYNNLDVIKEGQLLDLTSNPSVSSMDANLDLSKEEYKPKNLDHDEDDVSILDAMKSTVGDQRNLLD